MNLTLVPITKTLAKAPFDCGYEDLNRYLRHYAFKNDRLSIGKTFVALAEGNTVAGYMTLSTAQVEAESMPDVLRATLPRYPVPAMRIGKLAVDRQQQGRGVGKWLLKEALEKAIEISQRVGLFTILVDAIDEKAVGFYRTYGFVPFARQPLTLFLPLATIKKAT